MQPVKLTMRYFGPYSDETIDFRKLTSAPVFLVSGNTGSGKTTIFDAMCYALFGQTTNDQDRDATALRSDFAPRDQETSVSFIFEHQGKTYQITRKPKQVLKGRGNKLVEHSTKVSLIYPLEDEQPQEISKINVANGFIEKLLNLSRDQFKQIVLLPQGKFRQFLESSSNEKEDLLRDLFNTTFYQQWAQLLKKRLAEQKKQHQTATTKVMAIKEGLTQIDATLPNEEWLAAVQQLNAQHEEKITSISQEITDLQQQTTKLNHQIDQQQRLVDAITEREQKQKELVELQEQSSKMDGLRDQIKRLTWYQGQQKDYLSYVHTQDDLQAEQTRLKDNQAQRKSLQKKQQELQTQAQQLAKTATQIEPLRERKTVLQNQLPQYEKKAHLAEQVTEQQAIVKKHQKTVKTTQQTIDQGRQRLQQIGEQLAKLGDLTTDKLALEKQHHQFENVESYLDDGHQHQQQIEKLKQRMADADNRLTDIKEHVERAQQRYQDLKDAHARSEIARLVMDLKPGSPCPVCGSVDHPHPATISADHQVVSNEQVDAANQELMHLQQKRATEQSRLGEWQTQVQQEQATLDKLLQTIAQLMDTDYTSWDAFQKGIANWQQQLQQQQKQLTTKEQQQSELQTEQTALQEKIADDEQQLARVQSTLEDARNELATTQATLHTTVENLPAEYADQRAAQEQLDQWQKQIDEFEQQQKDNQQQLTVLNGQVTANQQLIKDGQKDIDHYHDQLTTLKKQLSQALKEYSPELNWDFWQWANEHISKLTGIQQQWQDYQTKQAQLHSLLERLEQQIAGRSLPDVKQSQDQLAQLQGQVAELQQKKGELQNSSQTLQETYQQVLKINRQQNEELKKIQYLQTVSDVMNGNTDNKLSLERYVLQSYLNEVLQVANERLTKLTNGRYAFVLSDDQAKGNGTKWSGLEINVYDDNAGQQRSVRTLSGGESFMASLALALGLGEVIQERSGGIQVDALFIDEGFGSLDQEALSQALNALQTIRGYKTIGIISHVTELENQVPDQLQVISRNGVSHVSYRHEINNL